MVGGLGEALSGPVMLPVDGALEDGLMGFMSGVVYAVRVRFLFVVRGAAFVCCARGVVCPPRMARNAPQVKGVVGVPVKVVGGVLDGVSHVSNGLSSTFELDQTPNPLDSSALFSQATSKSSQEKAHQSKENG